VYHALDYRVAVAGDVGFGTWVWSRGQSRASPVGCCRRGIGTPVDSGTQNHLGVALADTRQSERRVQEWCRSLFKQIPHWPAPVQPSQSFFHDSQWTVPLLSKKGIENETRHRRNCNCEPGFDRHGRVFRYNEVIRQTGNEDFYARRDDNDDYDDRTGCQEDWRPSAGKHALRRRRL